MLPGQPVEGQGFLDVLLDPATELGVDGLPLGEPGRQVAPGLGEVAPVVQPTQLSQTVIVDLTRDVVGAGLKFIPIVADVQILKLI
jgi:hypothetical protein